MTKTGESKFAKGLLKRMTPENRKKLIAYLELLVEKQGAK